jgi:hypothetical protein
VIVPTLSTGHQRFACARILGSHLTGSSPAFCQNAHHLGHCAEAASGGLNPHPVMRGREAVSHLSCSTTRRSFLSSCILLRAFVAHCHLRNSQRIFRRSRLPFRSKLESTRTSVSYGRSYRFRKGRASRAWRVDPLLHVDGPAGDR